MASGWGAGLTALSQGLMSMDETLRQRKLDELKRQEQERVNAERQAESKRQNDELKLRQAAEGRATEQFNLTKQTNALTRLQQFGADEPLTPEVVDEQTKVGNAGYLRTRQPSLESNQWQGDLYTETNQPAVEGGTYRREGPVDRAREDTQRQQREILAETSRSRDVQAQANREAAATQKDLDRQEREERDKRDIQGRKDVAGLIHAGNDSNGRPYYQFMTNYDTQGRPIGVQVGNARTGELQAAPNAPLLKQPPGDLGKQSIVNETALDQLDRLEERFRATKSSVGPMTGRINSVRQQMPGMAVDPKFADLEAASNAFTNSVIKAITGAQMSEVEARRIKGQIPLVTDKQEVWTAKAAATRKNLMDLEIRLKDKRPANSSGTKTAEELLRLYGDK